MSDESANAVQTIEEAWAALEDELLHAPGAQGTVIGAEDAARALALAVLAMGEFDCCFERREVGKCKCAFSNAVVRAQIEALGR